MKLFRLLSLTLLGCALVSGQESKPALDRASSLTGPMISELELDYQGLTYDGLRKAVPEQEYRTKLDFDPTKVRYFDLICEELQLTEEEVAVFRKRGFVCTDHGLRQSMSTAYHKIYTSDLPVLVTSDSILYALHKSHDEMLKELETTWFTWTVKEVFDEMQLAMAGASKKVRDPELVSSYRDVDLYLTVALRLLRPSASEPIRSQMNQDAEVNELLDKIASLNLENPDVDPPTKMYGGKRYIDYSQFRPRGHYTESEALKNYFRAMMWMGRSDTGWNVLKVKNKAIVSDHVRELRSAVLFVQLLRETGNFAQLQAIDRVLAYLVGRGDSMNYEKLASLMDECGVQSVADLSEPDCLADLQQAIGASGAAKQHIRSQLVIAPHGSPKAVTPATFQVFGQRFAIDSYVLSRVVFDAISFEDRKQRRMMPSGLDVMASFGNEQAVSLLEPELREWHYSANLLAGRTFVEQQKEEFWDESLYSLWLDSLRELDPDYTDHPHAPQVMQTRAWQQKQLQTQLASWSQLRHDTQLYVKQSYASVPGCEYLGGYVEPYPEFYARIKSFAERAGEMISASAYTSKIPEQNSKLKKIHRTQVRFFARMAELVGKLEQLADKELAGEDFDDDEREFISRTMSKMGSVPFGSGSQSAMNGWYVELFYENWNKPIKGLDFSPSQKKPEESGRTDWSLKPTIADVHTDPESKTVLEVGIGAVNFCVIAVDSEDDRMAFVGPTMSYYEFTQPAEKRLSDEEWTKILREGNQPPRPEWTESFVAPSPTAERGNPHAHVTFLRGSHLRQAPLRLSGSRPHPKIVRVDRDEKVGEIVRFDYRLPGSKLSQPNAIEVELTDAGLVSLRQVPSSLRTIDLSKSPITDSGLVNLKHLTNLRNLNVSEMPIDGTGLTSIGKAHWLRRLLAAKTRFSDEGVETLVNLPRLEILDLSETKITDGAVASLVKMSYLRELNLKDTAMNDSSIEHLKVALPKCKILR